MKAVVLAGGYATRLWPITKERPKMFLPVGETTVIDRLFAELEADERISEVFVSTNEYFADEFAEHLAASDFEKPTLSIEETRDEDEKFGVVGALAELIVREEVREDLAVVAGDNLFSFDFSEFLDFFEERDSPTLAAYDVESRERAKSYGLVELEGEQVVNFQEKPENPNSTLVSIACYGFPAEVLPLFEEYLSDGNNPDEPGWFMQWLQNRGDVFAYTFDGAWFDIGAAEGYLDAVEWALDGEYMIADSALVDNCTVDGGVQVLSGAKVTDSTLSRTVVFPDSQVKGAQLRDTVVDTESTIEGVDLSDAVVGAHTKLR
ncbi:glucose-1-phosphate thymidylyltransferase [Halogranum amylolyticum]|uniref:Glucose-1-phosphate thymidylyltransferase n=1 Tax=Halogranum amylolyticum TaxID=660520 RepID=A0A1H8WQU1_9EURY|nr:NDP-sugar synthase [Halogranum amylolyticum]SEP29787.1 glucose-1-phosphate thymidylyltransferase [Halogranum amylolyticum]